MRQCWAREGTKASAQIQSSKTHNTSLIQVLAYVRGRPSTTNPKDAATLFSAAVVS